MNLTINPLKLVRSISPKKAEAAAEVAMKDSKELTSAQDILAGQNKAMIKPFEKPKMESANLKKENTKAASGGDIIDVGGGDGPLFAPEQNYAPGSRESFEQELSGLFDDMGL